MTVMTEATAIRVRRRVLGERSFGVFIVSNGIFPPRGQEEAQCWPKGLSMVMELTMGCITCCWEMKLKLWPDRDRSPRPGACSSRGGKMQNYRPKLKMVM